MAVPLLFQNHCGTGVQRAENADGNEWQAFWWTHKLIQSRKAKVLSLFPCSHWWICPSCNFGCCSAVVAVGLWSGAVWCWVSHGGAEPREGTGGPRLPILPGQGCAPSWVLKWVSGAAGCAASGVWREWSWTFHSSAKALLTLLTYSAALLESWRQGTSDPWPADTTAKAPCSSCVLPHQKFSVP